MVKVGWVVLSFYALTAGLLLGVAKPDHSGVSPLPTDRVAAQKRLASYCEVWSSHPECLFVAASARQK